MPVPQRTARIEDDIWDAATTRAKAEGASLGALMRAAVQRYASGELTSTAEPASQEAAEVTSQPGQAGQPASQGGSAVIAISGEGEPSPGAVCAGPGCWNRDTARYGLSRLPLPCCAAALPGQVCKREPPESAARVIRRSALPGPCRHNPAEQEDPVHPNPPRLTQDIG